MKTYAPFFRFCGILIMTDMEKIEDYIIDIQQPKSVPKKSHRKSVKNEDLDDIIEPKIGIWHWLLSFFKSDKRIGDLNGHWAFLFKFILLVMLLVIPTIGTWGIWVTNNVMSAQFHIEQTQQHDIRITTLEKHLDRNTVIAQNVEAQIHKLEQVNQDQNSIIDSLEKSNTTEHNQILILLESMKTTLELLKQRE